MDFFLVYLVTPEGYWEYAYPELDTKSSQSAQMRRQRLKEKLSFWKSHDGEKARS